MNPISKMREYFAEKSGKQRVLIVICFALIAVFVFFFIKGNFFDKKETSHDETSVSDTSQAGEDENGNETQVQGYEVEFHISFIDVLILIAIVVLIIIHKIREKIKHRRM